MRRRSLLVAASSGLAGCSLGPLGSGDTPTSTPFSPSTDLQLSSPAFKSGGSVPRRFTCDGEDVSPQLRVGSVPENAAALALLVDDPNAPSSPFTHWLLWNVPSETSVIEEGVPTVERVDALNDAPQGTNGFGNLGYRGPCPPKGDGPHTYRFTLYAQSERLGLQPGAKRGAVDAALQGSTVGHARLTATYER